MKQLAYFALFFVVIVIVSVLVGWLLYNSQPSTQSIPTATTHSVSTSNTPTSPSLSPSDRAELMARNPNGPWNRDVWMATSVDGTTFTQPTTLVQRAGVPTSIRTADDRLITAFQWFPEQDEGWDQVAVVISEDDGQTWTEPTPIKLTGLPAGYQRPFDPTLALTSDGRIRLYFTSSSKMPGTEDPIEIYSTISDDGIHYQFEDGIRHAIEGGRAYDSAVVFLNDLWHIMTPAESGAYHATSTDGLTFSTPEVISSTQKHWTGNLVPWNEGVRFYGSDRGKVWWSFSQDGTNWSSPQSTKTSGGDPALVELADESYLLIFVSPPVR